MRSSISLSSSGSQLTVTARVFPCSPFYAATSSGSTNSTTSGLVKMPQMAGGESSSSSAGDTGGAFKSASNYSGNVPNTVVEKKPGVIRLSLASDKTAQVGEGVNSHELFAAVQNTLAEYLKMPNIELVRL